MAGNGCNKAIPNLAFFFLPKTFSTCCVVILVRKGVPCNDHIYEYFQLIRVPLLHAFGFSHIRFGWRLVEFGLSIVMIRAVN